MANIMPQNLGNISDLGIEPPEQLLSADELSPSTSYTINQKLKSDTMTIESSDLRNHLYEELEKKDKIILSLQNELELEAKKSDLAYRSELLEEELSQKSKAIEQIKETCERLASEKRKLIPERDLAYEDLFNDERAFTGLQSKYERTKSCVVEMKLNEEEMAELDEKNVRKLKSRRVDFQRLVKSAQKKLETTYESYEKKVQQIETENMKLKALLRKTTVRLDSLQIDLEQRKKDNKQLSTLCDELINAPSKK